MTCGKTRELKALLAEASLALARLDAARLEQIARCCTELIREAEGQQGLTLNVLEFRNELRVLGRVVDSTRANLAFLRVLGDREDANLNYGHPALRSALEVPHGDH
jgi:hypothetical protein